MKQFLFLFLIFAMCGSLCACEHTNESSNFKPTSTEDTIAYALLSQSVPNEERDGTIDILAGGSCRIYTDYADGTLVSTTTYFLDSKGKLLPCVDYGLFDGTDLIKYFDNISEAAELDSVTRELEYSEFYVSKDVCLAIGIETYQEMWEPHVTSLACEYLMEYMNCLKNPYTIEIHRVDCSVELNTLLSYKEEIYFTVTYSSENDFGGTVTSTFGNHNGISLDDSSSAYLWSQYADSLYYIEDETYARNQVGCFALDSEVIQEYILKNY